MELSLLPVGTRMELNNVVSLIVDPVGVSMSYVRVGVRSRGNQDKCHGLEGLSQPSPEGTREKEI